MAFRRRRAVATSQLSAGEQFRQFGVISGREQGQSVQHRRPCGRQPGMPENLVSLYFTVRIKSALTEFSSYNGNRPGRPTTNASNARTPPSNVVLRVFLA